MANSEFYDIVKMDGIKVSIPQKSYFSIGTSPYYSHQHGLAIDIYPNLNLENNEVLSPVSGRIQQIRKLKAPTAKFSDGLNIDYLILLSNPSNSETVWKIMHINPMVRVGEKIDTGDLLGKTIRNGYFAYWSSPHLHLEIRPKNDAIRARGGKNFTLAIKKKEEKESITERINTNHIPIEIHSVYPEMILVHLPKSYYHRIFPFYGLKVGINNFNCILDGGIPHYKIGTIIFNHKNVPDELKPIYLGNSKIGKLHEISNQFGFFKFNNVEFELNDRKIRGISLYLANFLPLIKIIPYNKNEFSFSLKSIQYLKFVSCEP